MYFHQNAYSPDGQKLIITSPSGLSTINLKTHAIEQIVAGRVNVIVTGRKNGLVYYVKDRAVFATHLETKSTREIAKLPPRGSVASVNADETLLLGSMMEGEVQSSYLQGAAPDAQRPTPPEVRGPNGLTFNFNYTRSKAIGTINGNRSAYIQEKHLSTTDQPNILNAFYSYELPFGKGRMLNPGNVVARSLVSGWQISGITLYSTGTPLGPFTANCNVPQAGTCWASYNPAFTGPARINGAWGNGNVLGAVAGATPFIDVNALLPSPMAIRLRPGLTACVIRISSIKT